MKGQTHLDFRTKRKAVASAQSTEISKNTVKIVETATAFQPIEIPYKPTKVEKPKPAEKRQSGRIAKKMKQSVLNLKIQEEEEITHKRKSDTTPALVTKKQKIIEKLERIEESSGESSLQEVFINQVETDITSTVRVESPVEVEPPAEVEPSAEVETPAEVESPAKVEPLAKVKSPKVELLANTPAKTIAPVKDICTTAETEDESTGAFMFDTITDDTSFEAIGFTFETITYDEPLEAIASPPTDTPSPPSFLTEPSTPPVQLEDYTAPYKTHMTSTDRARIDSEKTTLEKLRKSLDIVITDRMARSKPTLYHQVEAVLRNSTRKDVTLSHVCKVLYLAPTLYTLEAKELRDFGGKVTEAFAIEFGKEWVCPLVGKDLQKRSDILKDGLNRYFDTHKEPDATVPEMKLPRLSLVVDKDDWITNAHLPAGIKALLDSHKKISEAEEESKKPKPKPVGSVKDRMAALRARLAKKNA